MNINDFLKKHQISFETTPSPTSMSNLEILQAYENKNVLVLEALSKSPDFQNQFKVCLDVHLFSNEKFLTQSYEICQFTTSQMELMSYYPKKMKMAHMILQNKDKRSKCFLFEKYLLNHDITFSEKEHKHLFIDIMNRNTWQFNFELFCLNENFNQQIEQKAINNLVCYLENKKDIFEKTKYLMNEKHLVWSTNQDEFKIDINYLFTSGKVAKNANNENMIQLLKIFSILPSVNNIPNIIHILQEQMDNLSLNAQNKQDTFIIMTELEKKILNKEIALPENQEKKTFKI